MTLPHGFAYPDFFYSAVSLRCPPVLVPHSGPVFRTVLVPLSLWNLRAAVPGHRHVSNSPGIVYFASEPLSHKKSPVHWDGRSLLQLLLLLPHVTATTALISPRQLGNAPCHGRFYLLAGGRAQFLAPYRGTPPTAAPRR